MLQIPFSLTNGHCGNFIVFDLLLKIHVLTDTDAHADTDISDLLLLFVFLGVSHKFSIVHVSHEQGISVSGKVWNSFSLNQ